MLCAITKAYPLHVFLSLAHLNIQNSLKHLNARRGKTLTESVQTLNRALIRVLLEVKRGQRLKQDKMAWLLQKRCFISGLLLLKLLVRFSVGAILFPKSIYLFSATHWTLYFQTNWCCCSFIQTYFSLHVFRKNIQGKETATHFLSRLTALIYRCHAPTCREWQKPGPKRTRCIYFSKHSLIERKTLSTETVNQTGHIDCKMICFHNTIISSLHSSVAQKLSTSMWKEPLISSPPSISF